MPLFREDQAAIHVSVAGVPLDSASWDAFEGGDAETQNVNYRPGGMQPSIEMGGFVQRSDVTVSRVYSDQLHALYIALDNVCGKAAMSVGLTPLDANGNPAGATVTYTGILKTVTRPNFDSTANAAAKLTLVMGANQRISAAAH